MRSRLFSRSLARAGKNSLTLLLITLFAAGCSSSIAPSYVTGDVAQALVDTCKKEYDLDLKAKIVGSTLWIYLFAEDVLHQAKEPKKTIKLFEIQENKHEFSDTVIRSNYLIRAIPEKHDTNPYEYDEKISEANNRILRALFRILSSVRQSPRSQIEFFCLVTADIKNGFSIQQIIYSKDLKKAFYGLISPTEFQHRILQDTQVDQRIIQDKEGLFLDYRDITWEEFLTGQIRGRVALKFEKPEVESSADIDREITKIVALTLKIYDYKDFSTAELFNALTKKKLIFNRRALLEGLSGERS